MRTRPAPLAAALLVGVLVSIAGCASVDATGPDDPAVVGPSARTLIGAVWTLESIEAATDGAETGDTETGGSAGGVVGAPSLRFDTDGTLTGTAGCRGFTSGYTLDSDVDGTASVTLAGLEISHSVCPAEIGDQETAVFDVIGQGFTAIVDGDTLTLERAEGGGSTAPEARLVYRAHDDDEEDTVDGIDGEWRLTKASDADGTMNLGGVPVTLVFSGTSVAGQAPCNGYTAEATVAGDAVAIGAVAQTRMACTDDARSELETRYLGALARVTTARLGDGPSATLTLSGPKETLVFARLEKKKKPN
jgi:heat shock protein HslJ